MPNRLFPLLAFSLLVVMPALAAASPTPAAPEAVLNLLGGATTAVVVGERPSGRVAFAGVGARVLAFGAGGEAAMPTLGASGLLPDVPEALALDGEVLLAAGRGALDGDSGPSRQAWLQLLDARDPAALGNLGSAMLDARRAGSILVAQALAYVVTDRGVAIVDVKNPWQPRQLGDLDTPDPRGLARPWWPGGLAVAGEILLVARPEGLFAASLAPDPRRPQLLGGWPDLGPAYDVAVAGSTAWVLTEAGLHRLDLAVTLDDPRGWPPPQVSAAWTVGPHPRALAVTEERAVVLAADGRLLVEFDITSELSPPPLRRVDLAPLASEHLDLALAGGQALVAAGRAGLVGVDLSDSREAVVTHPAELLVPPLEALDLAWPRVTGSAGPAGLYLLQAEADGAVRPLAGFWPEVAGTDGGPRRVRFYGTRLLGDSLYAQSADDGLWVLDVADPIQPVPRGKPLSIPGLATGHPIGQIEDHLYIPGGDGALWVVDTAAYGGPAAVTRLPNLGARSVLVSGHHLYVTAVGLYGIGHLHVLEAGNPAVPRYLRTLDFNVAFTRVSVAGDLLYLTGGFGDMAILDISDPDLPRELGRQKSLHVGQVVRRGDRLVAAQPARLESFTVLDPARPARRPAESRALPWGREDWPGYSDVFPAGEGLLVLRHQAGLLHLPAAALARPPVRPAWLPFVGRPGPDAKDDGARDGPPAQSADCTPPGRVTLVLDGSGTPGAALARIASTVRGRLLGLRPQPPLSVVTVDRQARRAGAGADLEPTGNGRTPTLSSPRLDLGLVAAARAIPAHAVAGAVERAVLVLASPLDADTLRLSLARAGWLRAQGAQVLAVALGPAGDGDALPRITGDGQRVYPGVDDEAAALAGRLAACGR